MNMKIIKLLAAALAFLSVIGCFGCKSNEKYIEEEDAVITETSGGGSDMTLEAMRPEHGANGEDETDSPETEIPETEVPETEIPETEVPETEIPETEAPENEETEEKFIPYNVPLTIDEQKLVVEIAKRFELDPELVFGVMHVETRYNASAVGRKNRYLGIMQISTSNYKTLNKRFGITDLMNFEQNVIAGCFFIRYNMDVYDPRISVSLLFYHGGPKYGSKMLAKGQIEDSYTKAVVKEMNRIIKDREALADCLGVSLNG